MNTTPTPIAVEPDNAPIARADEQLAHAHEQIARADEELARLSEQLAKMEREATRPPSAGPGPQSPPRRPALRGLVGVLLAACIIAVAWLQLLKAAYSGVLPSLLGEQFPVATRAIGVSLSFSTADSPTPPKSAPRCRSVHRSRCV